MTVVNRTRAPRWRRLRVRPSSVCQDGIQGRPNLVDGRVGRFGWKADTLSLKQFVGEAFRNELGLTNPIAPTDFVPTGPVGH
jgi:CxxC motif-containing protein (DUF1111 family)